MKRSWRMAGLFILCLGIALPVLTSENEGQEKAMDRIKAELKAMKERTPQTKCPISGKPIVEGKGFVYKGYFIATCCDNCPKAVEKDPLSAMLKIRKSGEEPALAAGYAAQSECPVSDKPCKGEFSLVKNNALVYFCCPGCPDAFGKDAEGTLGKLDAKKMAPVIITLEQTQCPISGHEATGTSSVIYKGKQVELCCDDCKAAFESDPDKYLQAMADQGIVVKKAG